MLQLEYADAHAPISRAAKWAARNMKAFITAGKLALAASQSLAGAVGHSRVTAATRVLNAASDRVVPVWTQHTPPPAAALALLPLWQPSSAPSSSPQQVAVFESCVVNMMGPPLLEGSDSDVRAATRRFGVLGLGVQGGSEIRIFDGVCGLLCVCVCLAWRVSDKMLSRLQCAA
jgi:hypothetical protein